MKGGAVLDKQKDIRFSLWKKRHTLPVIEKRKSITLLVLIIAASALLPGGAFGTFYMVVAGALLALLLTADRSLLWLVSIPGVGIIAFLTHVLFASEGTSVLWILSAFLYIPVGLVLAACIYNRQSLTVTTTAVAVVFGILLLLSAGIQLHLVYGSIREGAVILWDRLQAGLTDMLSSIGLPGENGVLFVYTEKEIQGIIQSAVMLLPAIGILTCQLLHTCALKFIVCWHYQWAQISSLKKQSGRLLQAFRHTLYLQCAILYPFLQVRLLLSATRHVIYSIFFCLLQPQQGFMPYSAALPWGEAADGFL